MSMHVQRKTPEALRAFTPYELAMAFRLVATEPCTSWEEDDRRQRYLARLSAEMDRRDVRLEDWAGL